MPYTSEHKKRTRERIVRSAKRLFNERGFPDVSIDDVMAGAGLTRGGFYNHFATKEDLFLEVVSTHRSDSDGCGATSDGDGAALIDAYVSVDHLLDVGTQCPLMALASDVAHASPRLAAAYGNLLGNLAAGVGHGLDDGRLLEGETPHARSLAIAALCVGSMVIARTVTEKTLQEDVQAAARRVAKGLAAGGALEPQPSSP